MMVSKDSPGVSTPGIIKTSIEKMQKYLEERTPSEEEGVIQRMEYLQVLVARSGQLLAEARYLRDEAINTAIKGVMNDQTYYNASASTINEFVRTSAKDLSYLVNSLDRINATATHQLDALRSILSYRKSQMLL